MELLSKRGGLIVAPKYFQMKKVIVRQRVAENSRLVVGQGVHELADALADDLVSRGLAELVGEKPAAKPVETATKEPEAETAVFNRRGRPAKS